MQQRRPRPPMADDENRIVTQYYFFDRAPIQQMLDGPQRGIRRCKRQVHEAFGPISQMNAKSVAGQNSPQSRQRAAHPRGGLGPSRMSAWVFGGREHLVLGRVCERTRRQFPRISFSTLGALLTN